MFTGCQSRVDGPALFGKHTFEGVFCFVSASELTKANTGRVF